MILISHRGNINGPDTSCENKFDYITHAIESGFECEIDLWLIKGDLYLGHDEPSFAVKINDLINLRRKLWVHCKNLDAAVFFYDLKGTFNFFWHETDKLTITSRGFLWVYPGCQPVKNSIIVLPEMFDEYPSCDNIGICSDYILKYANIQN